MPLVSQQGELANRLRNFFRLTGRIPSQVDETVVPVSVLQNLDQGPYRRDPIACGLHQEQVAVVGEQSAVFIGLQDAARGAFRVLSVTVEHGDGLGAIGIDLQLVPYAQSTATLTFINGLQKTELARHSRILLNGLDPTAVELWVGSDAAPGLGITLHRFRLGLGTTGAAAGLTYKPAVPIVIPAGGGIWALGRNANAGFGASWEVEYYPEAEYIP